MLIVTVTATLRFQPSDTCSRHVTRPVAPAGGVYLSDPPALRVRVPAVGLLLTINTRASPSTSRNAALTRPRSIGVLTRVVNVVADRTVASSDTRTGGLLVNLTVKARWATRAPPPVCPRSLTLAVS